MGGRTGVCATRQRVLNAKVCKGKYRTNRLKDAKTEWRDKCAMVCRAEKGRNKLHMEERDRGLKVAPVREGIVFVDVWHRERKVHHPDILPQEQQILNSVSRRCAL